MLGLTLQQAFKSLLLLSQPCDSLSADINILSCLSRYILLQYFVESVNVEIPVHRLQYGNAQ